MADAKPGALRDKDNPADFSADFKSREAWEKRAALVRRQVQVSQGLSPLPQRTPLQPIITRNIDRDTYTIENVSIESTPGHRVFGNLYRPKNLKGRCPVVLHPHGHWDDGRLNWQTDEQVAEAVASGAEVDRNGARAPLQAFSATLAQIGCIVFHYDMIGYCDSTAIPHKKGFDNAQAILHLQSIMGLQTWNSIRCLDFVLSLPDADPSRVVVSGASGGGTQSIILTAIDGRITCSVPVVMISMNMQGGCVCENAPLLRIGTNNVELAALAAPRPLGGVGAKDWTHDFETRGLPELKHIYQLYDAEDRVEGKVFPYPHNFNHHSRCWCYEFLNRQLKLGAILPIQEQFEPVPPEELRVILPQWTTKVLLGERDLRKSLTRTSPLSIERLSTLMAADDSEKDSKILADFREHQGDVDVVLGDCPVRSGNRTVKLPVNQCIEVPDDAPPALVLGYNRCTLAERAQSIVAAVRSLRQLPGVGKIRLIAAKSSSPAATIAAAVLGDAIDRAIIEQDAFDFDQITDLSDPNLLPGALKYGGMPAIRGLCSSRVSFVKDLAAAVQE